MKGNIDFNQQIDSQLCLKEKKPFFDENPPFDLLINPKCFIASEIAGISPEETDFVDAFESEDTECTSIMIDFLSYERNFVKNINILINILVNLIGTPIFKALPESILSYSRNILQEHKSFLSTIENILKNHSKIFLIEFTEALSHAESLMEAHKKYNFRFVNVENIANQLSIGEAPQQVISNINQIIEQGRDESIYCKHGISDSNTIMKHESQSSLTRQNSQGAQSITETQNQNENNQNSIVNHTYSGNILLITYFKLPINWQNYSISTVKAILQTKPFQSSPDPQITKALLDFIKSNENLIESINSIPKLVQISKLFVRESFPIVVNGRRFIREGKALKQCRKGTSERVLLLFSDIFVYVQAKAGRYLVPRVYRLSFLRIESHMHPTNTNSLLSLFSNLNPNNIRKNNTSANKSNDQGRPTIYFFAPRKSFILIFSSISERDTWFETLNEAIEASKTNMIVPKYTEAPLWIPDIVVNRCMNCKTQFSLTQRKHHCRGCGQIMCKNCLIYQTIMRNISLTKPVKVCKKCYNRINEERIRKENNKRLHPGQKDDEDIMISNLNKLIPQSFESSSETSEEDTNDMAFLLGCP
ncbi:hypothetical protein M9Y10_025902 [Tritrichomonas musculus]|uniref:FYVE-type domain-containing protein n=1 Tax=Tritrichomonas musculus TaxID=1915356 RepID=A0ABR2H7W1_9EUKA